MLINTPTNKIILRQIYCYFTQQIHTVILPNRLKTFKVSFQIHFKGAGMLW